MISAVDHKILKWLQRPFIFFLLSVKKLGNSVKGWMDEFIYWEEMVLSSFESECLLQRPEL